MTTPRACTIALANFAALAAAIGASLRTQVEPRPAERLRGGSVNECYRFKSAHGPLFVKVAGADALAMLDAEAAGLEELRRAHAVRIPSVLATGASADASYLALEWVALGAPSTAVEARLGEQLACQHRVRSATFGWARSNAIGTTPQDNRPTDDWPSFFGERRLGFQLALAYGRGYRPQLEERGTALLAGLGEFLLGHSPAASLLHGDLWGGNWAADESGDPVIFDPAVYYGDRETDLAMTRLFGGFGPHFYLAYEAAWPLPSGSEVRGTLYNLYHVLNHLNLFGSEGYLRQAETMLDRLLAELG